MAEINPSAEESLAFLRSMTEAGRDAPLRAGPYLLAAGGCFGLASLVSWTIATGILPAKPHAYAYVWLGAAVAFMTILFALVRRDRRNVENFNNRALNAVWTAAGFGIFFFWIGMSIISWRRADASAMSTMPIFVLALYGAAWSATSVITRQAWIRLIAGLTFVSVVLVSWLSESAHLYLGYAAALVLSAVVPGAVMMRQARAHPAESRQ